MEFFDLEFDLDLGDELSKKVTKRIKNTCGPGFHMCSAFRKKKRKCCVGGIMSLTDDSDE